jgi:YnbE-like lipoprotein
MTGFRGRPLAKAIRVTGSHMPALLLTALLGLSACTPTVKVATDEPITINLNVNIKHEILVKVDRELDGLFSKDSGLF